MNRQVGESEQATIQDYEQVLMDKRRLVKELDAIWNGEDCAEQASLCDIVLQIQEELPKLRARAEAIQTEWISVKERMPRLYEWTIVVIDRVVQKTAANYAGDTWDWFNDEADSAPREVVSHWIPFPVPPKSKVGDPQ